MPEESAPSASFFQRLIKNVVWLLILADFVALLWVGIQEPELFQALAEQTEVLVSAAVWVLAFVGLVAGGVLTNGFKDFDLFLENTRVQIAVLFLTAVLMYGIIDRDNIICLTSTMIVKVVPDLQEKGDDGVRGRIQLTVFQKGDTTAYSDNLLRGDSSVFADVRPKRDYHAVFDPDNSGDFAGRVEKRGTTLRGINRVVLAVQRIRYGIARFLVDCGGAGQTRLLPGTIEIKSGGAQVARIASSEPVRLRVGAYDVLATAQRSGANRIFQYRGTLRVEIRESRPDTARFVVKAEVLP